MNTLPSKRDFSGEEKGRRLPPGDEMDVTGDSLRRSSMSSQTRSDRQSNEQDSNDVVMGGTTEGMSIPDKDGADDSGPKMLAPHLIGEDEDDESAADDADMDFDERDFADAERKFEREMQALQAKRPPTPRSNPVLLELLEELDALASALEERIKDGSADEAIKAGSAALGLPSPKAEEAEDIKEGARESSPTLALRPRPQTPPLESLPFLVSGPPTPFSEIEELREDDGEIERLKNALVKKLAQEQYDVEAENDAILKDFARDYKPWRMAIEDFEEANRTEQTVADSSSPPPPDPAPLTAQSTPSLGRRRGFTSEYELQSVIKASEETAAREEQLRREREDRVWVAPETFNDQREAVVPDMLSFYEAKDSLFADSNNLIPQDQALSVLQFYPKKDNFTPEEHETFLFWYVQCPKRFGEIASKLEHRDYRDCVQHYYATKLTVHYKNHEAAFWKSKRGRRFAASARAARNQSSSLMASGYDGPVDQETQNTALTEKGRPRRAAAPTFGDNGDPEQSSTSATPGRRSTVGKESVPVSAEKPAGKRTRQMGPKEKPGRKPKAQPLAAAPGPPPIGPSPQKPELQATKFVNKTTHIESNPRFDELDGAQVLAGLTKTQAYPMPIAQKEPPPAPMPPQQQAETWHISQPVSTTLHPPTQRRAPSEGLHPEQPPQIVPRGRGAGGTDSAPAINSYWLVSENQDLRNYIAYFGTNWQAIADQIHSKTHTMVRTSSFPPLSFIRLIILMILYRSRIDSTS